MKTEYSRFFWNPKHCSMFLKSPKDITKYVYSIALFERHKNKFKKEVLFNHTVTFADIVGS